MSEDVKIIEASKVLQSKVGVGALDSMAVERCQTVMDSLDIDFQPYAKSFIDEMDEIMARAVAGELKGRALIQAVSDPIIQLKVNGAAFRYHFTADISNVILSFFDTVAVVDKEVISIIVVYRQAIGVAIKNNMLKDGGDVGAQMLKELKGACDRYLKRYKKQ